MFISKPKIAGYTRDGEQFAHGYMLLMLQSKDMPIGEMSRTPIRCLVRYVRLRQLGHFMMGIVHIAGHRLSVSGAYGNDGLPMDVPPEVYDLGVELPADLREAWNKGGGHNSAGSEAPLMREWARKTFPSKGRY